jgi:cytidylate kinase
MISDTKSFPVITVDGPAGSGKGTITERIASNLGWKILDSGALYRLVGLAAIREEVDFTDEAKLAKIAETLDVSFIPNGDGVDVILNGEDVSTLIRNEECGSCASKVAAISGVRSALLERQRKFSGPNGLVADGRDMGTVIFPDAKVKIYLTANAQIHAERRLNQLKKQGVDANLASLIQDIEERDKRDTTRKVAPLIPAADAIIIDTGNSSIDEVVSQVMQVVDKVYISDLKSLK